MGSPTRVGVQTSAHGDTPVDRDLPLSEPTRSKGSVMRYRMKKMMAVALAPLAAGAIAVGVAPTAAAATCGAGQACIWQGANYTGQSGVWAPGNGCLSSAFKPRSGINNTGYVIDVYSGPNCTGTRRSLGSSDYGFNAQSYWSCSVCRSTE